MHNFFKFLLRHTNFFVFLTLEVFCAVLVVNFNDYHRSSFLSTANLINGTVNSITSSISRYVNLPQENEALAKQNTALLQQIDLLQRQLSAVADSALLAVADSTTQADKPHFAYRSAHVVGGSTTRSRNMLTVDAGANDGIRQDMAVISPEGVVGLVAAVSRHYCLVLPIINTSSHISVKLKGSNHRGQLNWDGMSVSTAQMIDVPEHAEVEIGDTIVTSGASTFFPEGLMVGTVNYIEPDRNGGFYNIGVELAVDFNAVYTVQMIEDTRLTERTELENSYQ